TRRPCFPLRAMGLRRVFNEFQTVTARDLAKGCHIGGVPKEMNWQDGARLAGVDRFLHTLRVEQQCIWLNIHQYQPEPTIERRRGSRNKRQVWNDDLSAVIQTVMIQRCGQRDPESIRAVSQE